MDASTYGTIVHNVAQKLYQSFQPTPDRPVEITSDMLGQYLKTGDTALERMITREINSVFNKLDGENALQPLLGETLVIGKVIHAALKAMLKVDMELCPFTFVSAEKEEHQPLKINDDLTINLRMFIDRIDRVNGQLRFIDYKTGGDKMSASSVDSFFNQSKRQTQGDNAVDDVLPRLQYIPWNRRTYTTADLQDTRYNGKRS